mgnify:CR=1 FL=1|jgi:hypothetical protein
MGRKQGEYKETVTIRLTPNARVWVQDIKRYFQTGWTLKKYTNSLAIEQAIGHYWKFIKTRVETDGKYCACCGNPTQLDKR